MILFHIDRTAEYLTLTCRMNLDTLSFFLTGNYPLIIGGTLFVLLLCLLSRDLQRKGGGNNDR